MNILATVITMTVCNVVCMVIKNRLFGDGDEKSMLFLIGSNVVVFKIAPRRIASTAEDMNTIDKIMIGYVRMHL